MKSMRDCIMLQIFSPVLASVFVKVSVLVKTKKGKTQKEEQGKASRKYACHMCKAYCEAIFSKMMASFF